MSQLAWSSVMFLGIRMLCGYCLMLLMVIFYVCYLLRRRMLTGSSVLKMHRMVIFWCKFRRILLLNRDLHLRSQISDILSDFRISRKTVIIDMANVIIILAFDLGPS